MKTIVVTNSIHITDNDYSYHEKALKLISGYLEFTDFDILVLTNNVDYFKHINNKRLIIKGEIRYEDLFAQDYYWMDKVVRLSGSVEDRMETILEKIQYENSNTRQFQNI